MMGDYQTTTRLRRSTSLLALLTSALLLADAGQSTHALAQQPAASAQAFGFAIPAQDLNGAILTFARLTGVRVFYDSSLVDGLRSAEVNGTFTAQDALNRLLNGSGISYRFTDSDTVSLSKTASGAQDTMQLDPVHVEAQGAPTQAGIGTLPEAYAGGQVARGSKVGLLGNRDVMDTPFNTTAYTTDLMENQQARTVADVLQNDPSVRFTTSDGHAMENFTIRGFGVESDELAFNGLYGMVPDGHVPVEFLERVEVLKGPNALLAGIAPSGGVGGTVNLVPKRAGDEPLTRIAADYASAGQVGTHVDVGRRFGTDNRVGVRLNGVYRTGDTELDGQSKERILGSAAVDYRGDDLRVTLDAFSTQETNSGGSPMMAGFATSVLPAPDASTNLFQGLKGEQESLGGQLRAEYDLTKAVTVYAAVGGKTSEYSGLITSTQAISTTTSGIADLKMVNQNGVIHTTTAEAGVRGRFTTGPVKHEVVAGINSLSEEEDKSYTLKWVNGVTSIYSSGSPYFPGRPNAPVRYQDNQFNSLALADTLSFLDDRVALTLGGRQQSINNKTYTDNTGVYASGYDDDAFTPAVGVVLKPFAANVSLYGNYIEGLTQGGRVTDSSASNYGQVFAPHRTKQKELGVKWDAGKITNTLSAFHITKPSLSTNWTTHVVSEAEQTNKGLEWNVFGELTPGVRALGGVTYMRSELSKTASGQYDGNEAYGTPHWQGNVGVEWDLPWIKGLTVDGRAVYTGAQYVNSANTLEIPDWWRFDLGARYMLDIQGRDVAVRASVTNLMDSNYWVGSFSDGYVTLNSPRTFMLSTAVDF
ncbi:TonB-dependent siderophore receptor [Insolitispirillum peregrinum]|uniref:TonB-dependent siderophore receptor n=1 Tax=Insolitispirillum peregrinum TaxID=80876 RepID=UPI00361DF785